MTNLKTKLLSLDLVVDNSYLDRYVELIDANQQTKRIKFQTQIHHIVPKCYYAKNGIPVESDGNLVILIHKDHVLAHYYLCRCAKEEWFRIANIDAFKNVLGNFMYKKQDYYEEERQLIISLEDYQLLLEETNRAKSSRMQGIQRGSPSKETREKLRQANLGRKQSKETIQKRANSLRGQKRSEEFRAKMSQLATGRKVSPEVSMRAVETRIRNGNNKHSEETKEKMRQSAIGKHKGKVYINNGKESRLIDPSDIANFGPEWVLGNISGRRWMTDGSVNIMVFPHEMSDYLEKGFRSGMTRNLS